MKFHLILNPDAEESVTVIAHQKTPLTDAIESLVCNPSVELIGYKDGMGIKLSPEEIHCLLAEDDKIYALTESEKLQLNGRLYQWEEQLPRRFVRINRSVIANLDQIRRFDATVSGTMQVVFCRQERRSSIKLKPGRCPNLCFSISPRYT